MAGPNFPLIYRQIAEQAGVEAAIGLAQARGGQRIYVPKHVQFAPWIAEAMGNQGAAMLIDLYGGEAIDLPLNPFSADSHKARALRVVLAIDAGLSANEIASAEGLSRRSVFRIDARRRGASEKRKSARRGKCEKGARA